MQADQKTNMQYTTPLVVDHTGDQKGKGRESGSRLKQLINEFLEKVKGKKDKTEARFKGLAGEDATKKVRLSCITHSHISLLQKHAFLKTFW